MPTSKLPDNVTKVSYILEKRDKPKLVAAAEKGGISMSALITNALVSVGILPPRGIHARKKEA